MALNTPATTTDYNPSELEILRSLDADTTSFEGHEFHDRVCLTGHKTVGRRILNLDGAVFHEEVTLSLTDWYEVSMVGARFNAGLYMRCTTMVRLYASYVRIRGVADFMDMITTSADFEHAQLPTDVWTRKGDLVHDIVGEHCLLNFARYGSQKPAA